MSLYEPPTNQIIAGFLVLAGMWAAARSTRLVARGLRQARSLDVVRGIRVCILALVAGILAVGLLSAQTGFVILGAIILGEELYETGILAVLATTLRRGRAGGGGACSGRAGGRSW